MISVEARTFADALKRVKPALPRVPTNPVLNGVRVDVAGDRMTVTATDLDLTIETTVPCSGDGLSVVVKPTFLTEFAGRASGVLALELVDGELVVESAGASIAQRVLPTSEWPRFERILGEPVVLKPAVLDAIRKVVHAASVAVDEKRALLKCVAFDGTTVVACDSYRLAAFDTGEELPEAFVPASLWRAVDVDEPVTMTSDGHRARFDAGATAWSMRLIPGPYVAWRQLLPVDPPHSIVVDRAALLDALETVRPMALTAKEKPTVRLDADEDGALKVSCARQDIGLVEHRLACGSDQPVTLGFDVKFLADLLTAAESDEVALAYLDPLKPAVVVEDDLTLLLMPVRIPS